MNSVKVQKNELLQILIANRSKHRQIFLEAQEGYRAACIKELDAMLEEAKNGQRIRRTLKLVEPMDQTAEYDTAISMLEMSVDKVIELDAYDFKCYVLDEWNWKGQWMTSNRGYSVTLSRPEPTARMEDLELE